MKLYCLPFAGGSAYTIYSKYKKYKWTTNVEIIPVELSGKGIRIDEKVNTSIQEIVNEVIELINVQKPKEYSILGHSMGGLLAYEVAYHMFTREEHKPSNLIISGYNPPFILDEDICKYKLKDEQFIDYLVSVGGVTKEISEFSEFKEKFLRIIRNDYKILENYNYITKCRIDIPTTILYSDIDNRKDTIFEWDKLLSRVNYYKIPGNHYYINNDYLQVARVLDSVLHSGTNALIR